MPFDSKNRRVSAGYSVETRTPLGRSSTRSTRRVAGDRDDHLDRVGRGLRVPQLAEAHHVGAGLLDPVASGDPEVEQPVGHVGRDLLGSQDADLADPGVVDGGPVVDGGRPDDGEVGGLEQLERGALERSLREDEPQHGRFSITPSTPVTPAPMSRPSVLGRLLGEEPQRVGQDVDHGLQALDAALGRARRVEDDGVTGDAGDAPREPAEGADQAHGLGQARAPPAR